MDLPSTDSAETPLSNGHDNSHCLDTKTAKLSYRKWRNELKKQKRKEKRKDAALLRDSALPGVSENQVPSDNEQNDEEEKQRQLENEKWLEREREAQAQFLAKKDREEKERLFKEEEERKIKEWADEQIKKKEEELHKDKEKSDKEKLRKSINQLQQKQTKNETWQNPPAPPGYHAEQQEVKDCPFFKKVGACRFGFSCKRAHNIPETSSTLLFPGMFAHFELEQYFRDEFDSDLTLEYEEGDIYNEFKSFYEDVLPEFETVGRVTRLVVCCNYEPHLRGNVYVQYASRDEATSAYERFNGRWYSRRQISCQFTTVDNWKSAICGLFHQKKCPKGKNCNFLHAFQNPTSIDRRLDANRRQHKSSSTQSREMSEDRRDRWSRSRSRFESRSRTDSHYGRRKRRRSASESPPAKREKHQSRRLHRRRHSSSSSSSSPSRSTNHRAESKSSKISRRRRSPSNSPTSRRTASKSPDDSCKYRSRSNSPVLSKSRRSKSKSPSSSHRSYRSRSSSKRSRRSHGKRKSKRRSRDKRSSSNDRARSASRVSETGRNENRSSDDESRKRERTNGEKRRVYVCNDKNRLADSYMASGDSIDKNPER